MWQHEIIEGINRYWPEECKKPLTNLSELVADAQTFYLGDTAGFDEVMEDTGPLPAEELAFAPYPLTLVEWSDSRFFANPETNIPSSKRAVLIVTDVETKSQVLFDFYYLDKTDELSNNYGWFVCLMALSCHDGTADIVDWSGYGVELVPEEHVEDIKKDMLADFFAAKVFIDVINSKNVVYKNVVPRKEKNNKRRKEKKFPLRSYKILEIVKGKADKRNVVDVPWDYKSPESARLHFTRGHFKTYTEEDPLFGKHVGTYWWGAHLRGSKERGVVEKEYHVRTQGHKKESSDERI